MKTTFFMLLMSTVLLMVSCQKEDLDFSQTAPSTTLQADRFSTIEDLIPENVSIIQDHNGIGAIPIFLPDTSITLTSCASQQCFRLLPNLINQMQRIADKDCRPINLSVCCCIQGYQKCYKLKMNPKIYCPFLEEITILSPKKEIQLKDN